MERTIRVTGKAKISVKPDRIRLNIRQENTLPEYRQAVEESTRMHRLLADRLAKLGFEKQDLKTVHFDVDTRYESYQAKDSSWKKRLTGYRYTHAMKLEFPSDNGLLGKVLYALSHCPGQPEFSIVHTVADPEPARRELLAKAVADSREKAQVLTAAAGVQLGQLQHIDYSWGQLELITSPIEDGLLCCKEADGMGENGYDFDVEPDDIDITDTVTVIWEING